MANETRSDSDNADDKDSDERVAAGQAKPATKKATKKKSKAKTKKKSAAGKPRTSKKAAAAAAAPEAPSSTAPRPASVPPSAESRSAGPMRGIVALWGPLAIIVLLIVVARIGDDESVSAGATARLPASIDAAGKVARDVVEDVRDALTGGDPRATTAPGAGRSSRDDLAAAFQDAGVAAAPGDSRAATPPPPKSARVPDPWDASSQTTVPAGAASRPPALPPYPDNPWAPVDPRALSELPGDPYSQGIPPPPGAGPPPGYGRHAPGYEPGGMYSEQDPYYPRQRRGYGPPPGYGERAPGYGRQHAYGGAPGYGPPPGYGEPGYGDQGYDRGYDRGYRYPQPYYGEPAPYAPPDYYPPAQ